MRAIDADALDDILADGEIKARKNRKYVLESAINTIRGNLAQMPTIESERKRGKWIMDMDRHSFLCSMCGAWQKYNRNYCPNCGADMREVDDERPD